MIAPVQSERFAYFPTPMRPTPLDILERYAPTQSLSIMFKELLHTRKSLLQVSQQNKEAYLGFVDKLDNDIVFRLTVTKQYYLLRALFEDPSKAAQWQALLEEIENEEEAYKKHVRDAWTEFALAKTMQLKNESTVVHTQNPAFSWSHPDPKATEMEQWAHYERELQRITVNYHRERSALHLRAYDAHLNHLDEVLDHLRLNEEENRELIGHLEEQRVVVQGRRRDLLASAPPSHGRIHDIAIHKKHDEECESLRKDIGSLIQELHQRPEAQKKEIVSIKQKYDAISQQINAEEQQLDQQFVQQKTILLNHIEAAKIKAISKHLNRIDKALEHYVYSQEGLRISEPDKLTLEQSIGRLEHLKVELRSANDRATVERIEQDIDTELHVVNRILLLNTALANEPLRESPVIEGIADASSVSHPIPPEIPSEQPLKKAELDAEPPGEMLDKVPQRAEELEPGAPERPVVAAASVGVSASASVPDPDFIAKQQQLRSSMQLSRGADPITVLMKEIKITIGKRLKAEDVDDEEKELLIDVLNKIHSPESPEPVSQDELISLKKSLESLTDINSNFTPLKEKVENTIESMPQLEGVIDSVPQSLSL